MASSSLVASWRSSGLISSGWNVAISSREDRPGGEYLRRREGSVHCLKKVNKEQHAAFGSMFDRGTTQLEEAVTARFA